MAGKTLPLPPGHRQTALQAAERFLGETGNDHPFQCRQGAHARRDDPRPRERFRAKRRRVGGRGDGEQGPNSKKAQAAGSTAVAKKSFPIPKAGGKDNQIQMITGLCGVQMKSMRPESCHCLAEQSLTGLSDPQRDYLIATVVSPPAADRMLADGRVGQPDQKVIAAFIDKTSDACATGKFVAPAK